jgi:hypothetical protein
MPFNSAIINIINTQIANNSLCGTTFANAMYYGIAYDSTDVDSAGTRIYPAVLPVINGVQDLSGNYIKVSPDDTYPLQIYHKILNKSYQIKPSSVGSRSNVVSEKTDVKMVVAGWTNLLGYAQEDIEALITSNFPDQIVASLYTPLQLQNLVVTLQSSILDKAQVYAAEYKGIPYQVKPEQVLFAIRYQIESTYKKGCFIINPDCQPTGVLQ